jgi:beta-galactosidase
MVHIANEWKIDSPLEVRVFSNCDEVELFLNGKSIGRQKPDQNRISNNLKHPPFTFHLNSYKKGTLLAKAFVNNKLVSSHTKTSPEAPTEIDVKIEDHYKNLKNEDNDVFFVHAAIVDKNNTVISDFTGNVLFHVDGKAELIGENPVNFEAGVASILLKTNSSLKDVKVTATSKELALIISNK